ncbi:MAG: hypothetical protein FJ196_00710 [Gammaproteobacteria bacterium]|nr:hypothetical protein [Gammaproteobacteria bacterium]
MSIGSGSALRVRRSGFDELSQRRERIILKFAERAVVGAVCRNLRARKLGAAREAIQIVLRTNAAIEAFQI